MQNGWLMELYEIKTLHYISCLTIKNLPVIDPFGVFHNHDM